MGIVATAASATTGSDRPATLATDRGGAPRDGARGTRARLPDASGYVERDGVRVAWERYGSGDPTILLMPTWSIFPSRHWKLQIPYLARTFRVVTFDGRGSGRSDRPTEPAAYADDMFAADALAVLDASGTDRAVVAGISMGAALGLRLAVAAPERVLGLIAFGPSIPVSDVAPDAPIGGYEPWFEEPRDPDDDDGWGRYNAVYWRRDWPGFVEWFVGTRVLNEAHSTKPIEDGIGWALETDPDTIIAIHHAPTFVRPRAWGPRPPTESPAAEFARRVSCPVLVVNGTADRIVPMDVARRQAELLRGRLVAVEGGGHAIPMRDPVFSNLLIRDFVHGLSRSERAGA